MPKTTTVGEYLIHRLEELKVKHVFGVPGDYVLGFYDMLVDSNMKVVGIRQNVQAYVKVLERASVSV